MQLEQRDKELAAVGASIGCNCRPCIEHHIAAGRAAGLSDAEELTDAVATARVVRDEAIELLAARIDELLGAASARSEPATVLEVSRVDALVSIAASVGANSHPLLRRQIAAALELGLSTAEVKAAVKMATYVQQRASEMTAQSAEAGARSAGGGHWPRGSEELTREVETCTRPKRFRWLTPGCTAAGAGDG